MNKEEMQTIIEAMDKGFRADSTAQAVIQFHRVDIVTPFGHPVQRGDRKTARNRNGDEQTVWHTVHSSFLAVSREDAGDAFFNPVRFGTGGRQTGSNLGNQLNQ